MSNAPFFIRKKLAVTVRPSEPIILFEGKVIIRSQTGGRLHFPCLPFNPCSNGNRSTMDQAFLRLEVPIATGHAPTKVRIKVQPQN